MIKIENDILENIKFYLLTHSPYIFQVRFNCDKDKILLKFSI